MGAQEHANDAGLSSMGDEFGPGDLDGLPVDELGIDVARDTCETCGRPRPDEGCVACGGEES